MSLDTQIAELTGEMKAFRQLEVQRLQYESAEAKRKWWFMFCLLGVTAATVGIKLAEAVGLIR